MLMDMTHQAPPQSALADALAEVSLPIEGMTCATCAGNATAQQYRIGVPAQAGSDEDVVEFTAIHARKLKKLIIQNESRTAEDAIKNKLVRNYLDCLREADRVTKQVVDGLREIATAQQRLVEDWLAGAGETAPCPCAHHRRDTLE